MTKKELAAQFFSKLGQDSGEFVTKMIETEMDSEIIDIFNRFGGKLTLGEMEPERFQSSLLIIGYLIRAHEEAALKKQEALETNDKVSTNAVH